MDVADGANNLDGDQTDVARGEIQFELDTNYIHLKS